MSPRRSKPFRCSEFAQRFLKHWLRVNCSASKRAVATGVERRVGRNRIGKRRARFSSTKLETSASTAPGQNCCGYSRSRGGSSGVGGRPSGARGQFRPRGRDKTRISKKKSIRTNSARTCTSVLNVIHLRMPPAPGKSGAGTFNCSPCIFFFASTGKKWVVTSRVFSQEALKVLTAIHLAPATSRELEKRSEAFAGTSRTGKEIEVNDLSDHISEEASRGRRRFFRRA